MEGVALYPMHLSPTLAPQGQAQVIEPQLRGNEDRYSVMRSQGIEAYKQRGPVSTLLWVV